MLSQLKFRVTCSHAREPRDASQLLLFHRLKPKIRLK